MLRINLLPPYIYDDIKKRNYMLVAAAIVLLAMVGCGFVYMGAKAQEKAAADRLAEAKTQKETHDSLEANIKSIQAAAAADQSKSDFVANARTFNDAWPKMYEDLRGMTSPKVVLNSMRLTSPTVVEVVGYAPTELDVAQWWMELRKSDKFEQVQFDLPTHPYPPTGATGGTGASMANFGGAPAGGGGMSGGNMGSAMMAAMMSGGGRPNMGGGGGGTTARRSANANVGPTELEGRPGIAFAGRMTLKKAFADGKGTPAWPAGGAAGGTGGGGMMGGGMSGMMSGGMSGMMSGGMSGAGGGGGAALSSTGRGGKGAGMEE
jgi:hypothetical protein